MTGMECREGEVTRCKQKNDLFSDINDDISGAKQGTFHSAKLNKLYCSFNPTSLAIFPVLLHRKRFASYDCCH